MAEKRSSPPLSVWVIGLAAMIPFVASATAFRWGHAPLKGRALEALLAYAAVILAFYGGIRAGLEIGRPRPRWSTLSLALAVPLVAWGLLLGVGRPTDLFKLSGFLIAYLALWLWDVNDHDGPTWRPRFRTLITAAAAISLSLAITRLMD